MASVLHRGLQVVAAVAAAVIASTAGAQSMQPPPPIRTPGELGHARGDLRVAELMGATAIGSGDVRRSAELYGRLLSYTRCVSKVNSKRAAMLLASRYGSREEGLAMNDIALRAAGCPAMGGVAPQFLRGGLAESMYLAKPAPPPVPGDAFLEREKAKLLAEGSENPEFMLLTSCRVAAQPAVAEAMLANRHGSPGELAEAQKLYSGAPAACGERVMPDRLNRALLRATVAQAMYRWSQMK